MENCLVTTLKGAAQNDNLPILGAVDVIANKWNTSGSILLVVEVTEACKVTVPVGETILTANEEEVNSREYMLPANTSKTLSFSYNGATPYPITIAKGSAVKTLMPSSFNTNITINPDTTKYQYLSNIVTFGKQNFMGHTTYGNKSHLLDLFWSTKMTLIDMSAHQFSGSIESIVEQLWGLGKRSGAYLGLQSIARSSITFHGASSLLIATGNQGIRCTFTASNAKISVDSSPSIATYDGTSWTYA